ncbi:uncharacterized protein IWZ02DRAFT_429457 [Phyllosticta citriasiana]|uniref:uncharacterized protein n=1 Tax=Phyllosticta citriasiana TaxID=595635 RepID=UPI0030FDA67B
MTTPTEHQRPIHLTNGPLPVSLSLDRFLVTWRDVETKQDLALGNLGCSTAVDAAAGAETRKPELFFRVGWDAASGGLLLYFHLPLKMRAAARGRRDVYLVVPAEGIEALGVDVGAADDRERSRAGAHGEERGASRLNGDGEREGRRENEDETGTEDGAVLRLRVALARSSTVLMPTAGAKRPLGMQSRGMLLSLKSLAQAREFEVALPHSRQIEDVLRGVADRAHGELRTPEIDHEKTFSGREWAEAPWGRYLLGEGERLEIAWNPVLDEAPPAYEDVVGGADDARGGLEVGEAGGEEAEDGDGPGAFVFEEPVSGLMGEQQGQRGEKGGRSFDTSEAHFYTGQTAGSLRPPVKRKVAAPTPAAAQGNAQWTTGSIHPNLKRKAASPPPPAAAPAHGPTPPTTRSIHPAVPITTSALLHTLHTYLSPISPPGALASQLPLPPHSQSVLHLGRSRALFSDTQYAQFFNGVAWLATLWPRQPDAHVALLPHCGRMMQCVRSGDAARFVEQRIEAMAAALTLSGAPRENEVDEERRYKGEQENAGGGENGMGTEKQRHGKKQKKKKKKSERLGTRNPFDGPPTQAGARLVEFVYTRVGEGVDNFIVDDLLALQEVAVLLERAAAAAAGLCGDGDGRRGLHAALEHASDDAVFELERQAVAFTFQMAACVMLALFKAHERDWFAAGAHRGVAV